MENRMILRDWIKSFNEGVFDEAELETQIKAGWYDWFCKNTSLKNKTKRMGQIIKQLKDTGKVNLDENYVWFKNNCPLNGPLYDDFRIANIKDGSSEFVVVIESPWEDTKFSVYSKIDFFDMPVFKTNKQRELVKWLNGEL